VDSSASPPPISTAVASAAARPTPDRWTAAIERLASRSLGSLLALWLGTVLVCALAFWMACMVPGQGLTQGTGVVSANAEGLLTALYFSLATVTTVGYGDIAPVGAVRALAVAEAAAGLLLFGMLVSRLVSRRQEQLTEEIHLISFETRLGRVRTALHMVLVDLQAIERACTEDGNRADRVLARIESTTLVFAGELRAVHDLLYRPQLAPEEPVLGGLLAGLATALEELVELLSCLPVERRDRPGLNASLTTIAGLAREICGECVPREYAPDLKLWMDRIQDLSARVESPARPATLLV
jgi:hypothetical protein